MSEPHRDLPPNLPATPDPSQPPAPPGCVFGPHNLSGAWVAVTEGMTGALAAIVWREATDLAIHYGPAEWTCAPATGPHSRAAIFSAAFGHERKRADAAETLRACVSASDVVRSCSATPRAVVSAVERAFAALGVDP